MSRDTWRERRNRTVGAATSGDSELRGYRDADAEMICRAMHGQGPDRVPGKGSAAAASPQAGMRVVFNISSANVPAFLAAPLDQKPYWNRYDRQRRLGEQPPSAPPLRERIDDVVAETGSKGRTLEMKDVYYGAVELNGTGIRYFGDFSLVLKPTATDAGTLVLSNNSFDLSRAPTVAKVHVANDAARTRRNALDVLSEWAGSWPDDVPDMAVCKILDGAAPRRRRLTTGTVSSGVLSDEDYIEVARRGSFDVQAVEEIRLSAQDAAADARIGDRIDAGRQVTAAEMQWRYRRRDAEDAAYRHGVTTRVVVTLGRDRG